MIVISQPTYFPWIGYFSLINASKTFVFLDDVQFNSRSWQQRNRISINGKINYLTIPIIKKGLRGQLINQTKIVSNKIFDKHILKIKHTYSRARYYKEYFPKVEKILINCKDLNNLSEINIYIIKKFSKILNLDSNFEISSQLKCDGKKSLKLINICKKVDNYEYIINEGAKNYIKKDLTEFKKNKIKVFQIKISEKPYKQLNKKFINKLSILDILFNEGHLATYYLKKNYKILSL